MATKKSSSKSTSKKAGSSKPGYETYIAVADAGVASALANTTSPFTITVRFLGGLTQTQMDAFKFAADRWSKMIVGDLPSVQVEGEIIDDVLILAQGTAIDGPGKILVKPARRGCAPPTQAAPPSSRRKARWRSTRPI